MIKSKKRILIVDDALFTRNLLKNIINKIDYCEVIGEASNGNEAISLYKEMKPDLVTMDLIMPGKDGIETTEEILKIDPDAQIVIISALGQEALVIEATRKGAKDFIQKPYKPEQISAIMEHLLCI